MFSMPKVASILVNPYDQTSNSGENYTLRKSGYIFLDAPLPPEMISGRKTYFRAASRSVRVRAGFQPVLFCIVILFSRRFYTNWMQEKWWWWLHKGNKMKATNGALVGGGAAWIKRDKGADQSFIHFAPITKKDAKYSLQFFLLCSNNQERCNKTLQIWEKISP